MLRSENPFGGRGEGGMAKKILLSDEYILSKKASKFLLSTHFWQVQLKFVQIP